MALTKEVKERIRLNKLVKAQPVWRFGFDNEFKVQMGSLNMIAASLIANGETEHYLHIRTIQERVSLFSINERKYLTKKQYEAIDRTKMFWLIRYFNNTLVGTLKTKEDTFGAAIDRLISIAISEYVYNPSLTAREINHYGTE